MCTITSMPEMDSNSSTSTNRVNTPTSSTITGPTHSPSCCGKNTTPTTTSFEDRVLASHREVASARWLSYLSKPPTLSFEDKVLATHRRVASLRWSSYLTSPTTDNVNETNSDDKNLEQGTKQAYFHDNAELSYDSPHPFRSWKSIKKAYRKSYYVGYTAGQHGKPGDIWKILNEVRSADHQRGDVDGFADGYIEGYLDVTLPSRVPPPQGQRPHLVGIEACRCRLSKNASTGGVDRLPWVKCTRGTCWCTCHRSAHL